MEIIKVGETLLPSGKPIIRLALVSRPNEEQPFRLLMADDGQTIYARQYPHMNRSQPDAWDAVGPFTGSTDAAYATFGFARQELTEFVKDV